MKLQAKGVFVVLEIQTNTKSANGILMPDAKDERIGKITSVGNNVPEEYTVGSTVKYKQYNSGEEIEENGKKYLVLPDEEILFEIKED